MRVNKNLTIRAFGGVLILALIILGIHVQKASANFIVDSNPGGEKFYIDVANSKVSGFTGTVGGNNSGPLVDVATTGNVDTGSGYANIKPVKDGKLTSLLFTPDDPNLFGDFSFRGQLEVAGTITVKVWDNQGNSNPFELQWYIDKANQDFERIGIVAKPGTGETINRVEIRYASGFKEVKQIDFSNAAPVPIPSAMLLLGSGLAGLVGIGRWRRKK